ncbi:MAG: 5-carboxymethyl-2-hydroxymuconate semialdehyde dehydrogenase [Bacillota bacterium]|jgi:5-carboxymethyl-2-hydroxymuconate semialdehyde dehydrogenase|nr:5-carboxymethyl-2-hydroxymuconate semialdehyde dehydrogenase [Bacillota bacterium]
MSANGRVEAKPALHYIDGRFCEGAEGRRFANLSPFTGDVLNEVAEGTAEDIDRAVRAARRAFDEGPWRTFTVEERLSYVERIADGIASRAEELARLESLDTGLPISQTKKQAARAADNFRFFAEMVRTSLTGEAYPFQNRFLNYTVRRPVGVAGLITPWNAPLMLATWKIAPALACGNTVVLKPAEWSPLTAVKLAEIIDEAGLPPGVFNLVHGFGETAGAALVAHPGVQLISFTGETTTGKTIMQNGAATLKRVSMELGGKSPVLLFADADVERALDATVFGIFSFNGERCTAGSRLLVEKPLYEEVVARLKERVGRIRLGDPLDPRTEVGPLIHPDHRKRVLGYIRLAKEEGAEVVSGAVPDHLSGGNFVAPTLLLRVTPHMRAWQEEIFGPVLAVMPFADEEEAIRLANGVRYGLAAYVWTNDLARAHRVSQALEAGMVWVNSHNVRDLRIPFGGMKESGIGREGGHYSFEFYTETQVIHVAYGHHPIPTFGKSE